ncbi:MAG: cyclase family protein [Bacteroidales bacterium]|nr:cyclase family protein [Bacteroidales bacterium]
MKIIDLSKPIRYNKEDPWFMKIKIKHKPHNKAKLLIRFLGLPFKLFPKDFTGWADDTIQKMGVHAATHIDAPWHYSPTTDGKKSKTIDEMPLELCFGEGVVIDMKHKAEFDPITIADIEGFLTTNKLSLEPGMIVLIKTGRDKFNGTKDFHKIGTGMSAEATEWLIDKGIKVMGIDSWGWDLPLPYMMQKAKKTVDSEFFWEAHLVGQHKEYYHMEQLVNLDALPYNGFKVAVFPLKIVGASAAPARVVALFD